MTYTTRLRSIKRDHRFVVRLLHPIAEFDKGDVFLFAKKTRSEASGRIMYAAATETPCRRRIGLLEEEVEVLFEDTST